MYDASLHEKVTSDKNFSFTEDNFVFAFMSLATQEDTLSDVPERKCYLDDVNTHTREWLTEVVESAKGKTLFLFMHYPLINRQCADTTQVDVPVYDWTSGKFDSQRMNVALTAVPYAGSLDRWSPQEVPLHFGYGFHTPVGIQDYSIKSESE